jgi:hypothetical protein
MYKLQGSLPYMYKTTARKDHLIRPFFDGRSGGLIRQGPLYIKADKNSVFIVCKNIKDLL